MSTVQDFLSLLAGSITIFAMANRPGLVVSCAIGIVLAAACWVACSYYSRLWNLRYRVTLMNQVFCAFAAILTLFFTVLFASLKYTKEAAYVSVEAWQVQVNADPVWAALTFATAYDRVKHLGLEDFSSVPPPGAPGSRIPTHHNPSIMTAASVYATAAGDYFGKSRPFLSKIIHAQTELPEKMLDADVKNYFATVSKSYPPRRAIALVAREIKVNLSDQLPRVVTIFRRLCVVFFFVAQLIPFGLIGVAAYKNLKVSM